MKHSATIAWMCAWICTGAAFAKLDTLTVIHVNDSHANLAPYGAQQLGGIAGAASVIGQWKMTSPNPILVHVGDFQVGTLMFNLTFGVAELQILNQLGFDALCLGNHEFDTGPKDLGGILAMAQLSPDFDLLCTNAMHLDSVPELKPFLKPYSIEQRGGLKIGLFGFMTPDANVESSPAPVVLDTAFTATANQRAAELRSMGCHIVMMLSHLGFEKDKKIAATLIGVDAIIGGHSHDPLSKTVTVNGIPIVQAGEFYRYVGKLRLVYDGAKTSVLDYALQEITPAVPAEPTVDATVKQLMAGISQQYGPLLGDPYKTITYAKRLLTDKPVFVGNHDTLDTPVGNLVTQAMLDAVPQADCALEACGHTVENLYPGPVTTADLFRVYPYGFDKSDGLGFRLASFDLKGEQLAFVLQALFMFINPAADAYNYLPQSAGLDLFVDASPSKGFVVKGILIKGKPLNPDSVYTIASSSQVVGYLQKLFGIQPTNLDIKAVSVFQALKEYAARQDTLRNWKTGHILMTGVKAGNSSVLPRQCSLEQNYPNPFNPETTITIRVLKTAFVTLKVYDLLGREVETLVHQKLEPGEARVVFHGERLNSGVYAYKLTAGDAVEVKKMVLLR
jgi:2',3'-cyclic-nucleotide 2'-phosphodiesterase (5'-nucleotidase family)